jgi:hypothetical protein
MIAEYPLVGGMTLARSRNCQLQRAIDADLAPTWQRRQ